LDCAVGILGLVGQTILLGIAAAFTPSLLALQILVCSGDPWRRRAAAVAVGGSSAFILVGGLLYFGFAQLPTSSGAPSTVAIALRLAAAVVLLGVGIVLLLPHPGLQQRTEHDVQGYVARASTWVFFWVAFALSIKDVSSFVVLAPALHDIAVSDVNAVAQMALLVLLFALALSPVLAPLMARLVLGHRADRAFQRIYRFTMDHQFQLIAAMALLICLYLGVTGIQMLLTAR
jgi:hypothetical protein